MVVQKQYSNDELILSDFNEIEIRILNNVQFICEYGSTNVMYFNKNQNQNLLCSTYFSFKILSLMDYFNFKE